MPEMSDWDEARIFTTGGDEEVRVAALCDDFFGDVSRKLGFVSLSVADNPFVNVRTLSLGHETPSGFVYSDDRVHELVVCNQLLAMVFDRRNDSNYHEVTFWHRNPSGVCANQIAKLTGA